MLRTDSRERGSLPVTLVLVGSLLIGLLVLASGASLTPAWSEVRRTRGSDEALALAEAGLALARAELAHDDEWTGAELELGRGRVEVRVEHEANGPRIRCRGILERTPLTPHEVQRRVTADLHPETLEVLAWEER